MGDPANRAGSALQGCAKFLASAGGGWSGWVSLKGVAVDGFPYGVTIVSNHLSGYAWSEELGWIDMSSVVYTPPPTVEIHFSLQERIHRSINSFFTSLMDIPEKAFAEGEVGDSY